MRVLLVIFRRKGVKMKYLVILVEKKYLDKSSQKYSTGHESSFKIYFGPVVLSQ